MADALGTPGPPAGPGVVSALDHRLDQAGLIATQGAGMAVRTGVMHGPGTTALVTGTSATAPMTYAIAAHNWVPTRGTADGVYLGATEAAQTVSTTAAPGANSRIDVIWEKQQDQYSTVSPDATSAPQYGVTQGTAAASPTKPPIPVGALELATSVVAAGATSTNGAGVTITNTARQTVARGAPIPVNSQAERDALTAFDGLSVKRLDLGGVEEQRISGAWITMGTEQAGCTFTSVRAPGSVPAGAAVNGAGPITITSERGGDFVGGTDTITVPRSGMYALTWTMLTDATMSGRAFMQALVNGDGATTARAAVAGPGEQRGLLSATLAVPAGQAVTLQFLATFSAATGMTSRGSLVRIGDLL